MKTNTLRIETQCPGCGARFGIEGEVPGVSHLLVQWDAAAMAVRSGGPVGVISWPDASRGGSPVWYLFLNLPMSDGARLPITIGVNPGGPCIGPTERPERYGVRRLGSGVWTLEPTLVVPDVMHAFVTITNVPDPAPWENPR